MIVGLVGLIGSGKTMLAVRMAVKLASSRDALIASNIAVTAPGVRTRQLSVGFDGLDMDELATVIADCAVREEVGPRRWLGLRAGKVTRRGGLVLLIDEVGILMPARFWQSFPVGLMFTLSQSRKLSADVIYTAQDVEQVDAFLRRLTQWVYRVRAIPGASIEKRMQGRRPWLYLVTRWRPATVDKPDKRLGRDWIRYQRRWEGWYNTDELVAPPERLTAKRGRRQPAPESSAQASVEHGHLLQAEEQHGIGSQNGAPWEHPGGDVVAVAAEEAHAGARAAGVPPAGRGQGRARRGAATAGAAPAG